MLLTPLTMIGDELPWQEKIDDTVTGSSSLGNYFNDYPLALVEFINFIEQRAGGLSEPMAIAMGCWARAMEIASEDIGEQWKAAGVATEGKQEPSQADLQALLDLEREWMGLGEQAPVVVARFTRQRDVGGGYIEPAFDDINKARTYWDATLDLLATRLELRNSTCEMDTDESDALRDGAMAPREICDWDGPFAIRADIYPPSKQLASLRERIRMEGNTAKVAGNKTGPRL